MNKDGDFSEDEKEFYRERSRGEIESKKDSDTNIFAAPDEEFSAPSFFKEDEEKKRKSKRRKSGIPFFQKAKFFIFGGVTGALISLFAIGSIVGFSTFLPSENQESSISIYEPQRTLEESSDLITTKDHYAGFIVDEDSKSIPTPLGDWNLPFTENSILVAYKGTIGLGFDIASINMDIDQEARVITLVLPKLRILYNELDNANTSSYVLKNDVFSRDENFNTSNELIGRIKAKEESSILGDEALMEEARTKAEDVIRNVLAGWNDTSEYQVVFEWKN